MAKLSGVTYQAKPLKKPKGIKKNRTALGKLSLIMRPNSIWLDSLT